MGGQCIVLLLYQKIDGSVKTNNYKIPEAALKSVAR
jgi:hypothetical protein